MNFWKVLRDARVAWISTFNPSYFERTLKERKGKCVGCQNFGCCDSCAMLGKDGKCAGYENRPQGCRDVPLDRFDLFMFVRINPKMKFCRFH